jgi:hypothetical protein
MLATLLLGCGLLAAAPPSPNTGGERADYEARKASTKQTPAELLKLAVWCESQGLSKERDAHLAEVLRLDPNNVTAHGLLGQVDYRGEWINAGEVAGKVKADAKLSAALDEYQKRRNDVARTADAHWRLAQWCDQQDLKAEARVHYLVVIHLDPKRDAAWRKLGYKKQGKRHVSETQIAAEKSNAAALKKAQQQWRPLLLKWRGWLDDNARRDEAEQRLDGVTDPRAVPAIWGVFTGGGEMLQLVAVRLFGQIDCPASSRALAMVALLSSSDDTTAAAVKILKTRDPREYAGLLVARLRDPVKYEVRRQNGRGSPGMILVNGEPFDSRLLAFPPPLTVPLEPGQTLAGFGTGAGPGYGVPLGGFGLVFLGVPRAGNTTFWLPDALGLQSHPVSLSDPAALHRVLTESNAFGPAGTGPLLSKHIIPPPPGYTPPSVTDLPATYFAVSGTPGALPLGPLFGFGTNPQLAELEAEQMESQRQTILAARRNAYLAEAQLQAEVDALERFNERIRETNQKIVKIISLATGVSLPADPATWRKWWIKLLGYKPDAAHSQDREKRLLTPKKARRRVVEEDDATPDPDAPSVSSLSEGTLVHTLTGPRAIESLRPGDEVLAQNVGTGRLRYQPVVSVYGNDPGPTVEVVVGGERLITAPLHRYWVAGKGWVKARDLKSGDTLRGVGRTAKVESVDKGPTLRAFNVDVGDDRDFFVGQLGVLAHDNTLPDLSTAPFDEPHLQ